MSYNERLKALATKGGTLKYVFGSLAQANLILDKIYKGAEGERICINIQPTDGSMTFYPGARDMQHILIGYATKIPLDYDAEEVQELVEGLKEECASLVGRINADGYWIPVEDTDYSVMFDAMDANLAIVLMDFRLDEAEGRCV